MVKEFNIRVFIRVIVYKDYIILWCSKPDYSEDTCRFVCQCDILYIKRNKISLRTLESSIELETINSLIS